MLHYLEKEDAAACLVGKMYRIDCRLQSYRLKSICGRHLMSGPHPNASYNFSTLFFIRFCVHHRIIPEITIIPAAISTFPQLGSLRASTN